MTEEEIIQQEKYVFVLSHGSTKATAERLKVWPWAELHKLYNIGWSERLSEPILGQLKL